jgi:flagellar FliL protein
MTLVSIDTRGEVSEMAKAATANEAPAAGKAAADTEGEAAPTGGKKKLLLIGALGLLLVGGGAGGFLYWKSRSASHAAEAARPKAQAPLQFYALDPPFVVNFQGVQAVRFLQIDVRLGSRDSATIDLLKANDPVVRNDLVLLFGSQEPAVLATREGKEKLRADALAQVRRIVKSAGGRPESLEAVFFTSFVMQ